MGRVNIIQSDDLKAFTARIFTRAGVPIDQARDAANVLVWANLHGVDTHGVRLLKRAYIDRLLNGRINSRPAFKIEYESAIGMRANGDGGLGLVAACWAMRKVIEKAWHAGAGFVTMHHSHHIGAAGYYAMMAVANDMIGISMTGNFLADGAERGLLPTFGVAPMLSTNPISVSFPTGEEPPFLLDMATSIVPYNRVEMRMEAGQSIPLGWGLDELGRPTTDPSTLRYLLPLGGSKEQGGHKGFGLALMVEVLCAVLSGGFSQSDVSGSSGENNPLQTHPAHFFGAVRIDSFRDVDQFKRDMDVLIGAIHAAPVEPGQDQIFVPGEIEFKTKERRMRDGIPIPEYVWADLELLSETYDVSLP